jgi:hypothetical protein
MGNKGEACDAGDFTALLGQGWDLSNATESISKSGGFLGTRKN